MSKNQTVPTYPLYKILDDAAQKFPDASGFDFLGKKFKWKDLAKAANAFAKGLQDAEVAKGTRIGLCLPNCPQYLVAYYGALKAGMTVVNFNPLYALDELEYQINDSKTQIMVTLDLKVTYDKVGEMLKRTDTLNHVIVCRFTDVLPFPKNLLFPVLKSKDLSSWPRDERHIDFGDLLTNDANPQAVDIDIDNDIALLQYTGGTTGVPKGAMLTHSNLSANTEQCLKAFEGVKEGEEKMLAVIPFFHVFAMTVALNLGVRIAAEIIAIPRFDLHDTIKLIDKKKPTCMPAVAAIYTAITNYSKIGKYDLTSLKKCISGGAPLPVEIKRKFESQTGCVLVEGYGLTETSPVTHVNPMDGRPNKPGSIGLPVMGTEARIIGTETGKEMPVGEKGEICVKGPQVMKGYLGRPEDTAKTIVDDGWLHTGDIAYCDEEGYYFIVDRIKDLIITNGYNVYPRHVEEAIYKHPDVEECIVGGLPCESRGEKVKAWVKLKEGKLLSEAELREFLEDKISRIEMPRDIEFRDKALPKTMIGKLSRKDIIAEEKAKTNKK